MGLYAATGAPGTHKAGDAPIAAAQPASLNVDGGVMSHRPISSTTALPPRPISVPGQSWLAVSIARREATQRRPGRSGHQ